MTERHAEDNAGDPSETLQNTISRIRPLDSGAMAAARQRHDQLTKPPGSLGRLEDLAVQVAGITGDPLPTIADKVIVTCAGDHGVTAEGVSAYPAAVTPQMVYNFVRGGAAINVLARQAGARIVVADLGVDHDFPADLPIAHVKIGRGTANIARGPAMSRDEAVRAIATGIALVERELGAASGEQPMPASRHSPLITHHSSLLFGTGDMGIGNTTASSAIVAAITGVAVPEVTGRGTGIDDTTWERKVAVIDRALAVNQPDPADALDVLAKVGGYEIGGIAGVILGAAAHRCPVAIDGFISGAGALLAATLCPTVRDYLIPAHASVEVGHRVVLERLGLTPLLTLNLRLGEGTGAALAMMLVDAALAILREMATFAEAGVSGAAQ
jgi:nicotinate-nucleotide--dimethylbenzimidazole phosphoribosyltransferase